jgi:hypothetical protein
MGHITKQGNGLKYWHPSAGFLFSNCTPETEGAEEYTPTKGKHAGQIRHRQKSFGYEGIITGVSIVEDANFGTKLELTFDGNVIITTDASGSYMTRFANICQQINPRQPVMVSPWALPSTKNPDKSIVGWTWKQGGRKLVPPPELNPSLPTCTLPVPRDVVLNGKKQKDWGERDSVLLTIVETWAEKHGLLNAPPVESTDTETEEPNPHDAEEVL